MRHGPIVAASLAAVAALLAGCSVPGTRPSVGAPTPVIEAKPARDWRAGGMVAAANPFAVEAGLEVLRAGGSAVDAAVAVQAVLGLVEPQSSGIGGGAFLVHYDAATGDVITFDGREVAPQGATPDMFLDAAGKPLTFPVAVRSGRAVGVPGVIAMLGEAHREFGRLPWSRPWQPAIRLAERGFPVSPRLNELIGSALSRDALLPAGRDYLTQAGTGEGARDGRVPLPIGAVLRNPAYADTLRRVAKGGARAFYEGPIAEAVVAGAAAAPMPGTLTLADLAAYRPQRLEPVCGGYRVYLVCGMRPPSSGGIAVLSALGTLENFDMAAMGPATVAGWHHFIEAQRLTYADRDRYVADDRLVAVPLAGLIDKDYLRSRAALVRPDRAMATVEAGRPPGAPMRGKDATAEVPGTSHFVVVDRRGNVVSMTTTVESLFGSQRFVAGFFLNNQLTDFSFRPVDARGEAIANAVAPGKKPRSSMSPTIVFRDGAFEVAVGSPGGNAIIAYVTKTLVGMLDWGLSPQQAVDLPNVIARGPVVVETARIDAAIVRSLKGMGHVFGDGRGEGSGLHAVRVTRDGRLEGAADPRREGRAIAIR
ncbi:MAG: gamma-glutamyltransferase [Gammaproteobacteria bacterium]